VVAESISVRRGGWYCDTFIIVDNKLTSMITGKIRERSDGHRYVTIPRDEDEFETGDHVKISKVDDE